MIIKKMAGVIKSRKSIGDGSFTFTLDEKTFQKFEMLLHNIASIEQKQEVTSALRAAATFMVNSGKSSFKKSHKNKTGNLFRSFTRSVKKNKKFSQNASYAGFKRNANKNKNNGGIASGNHAHLIDRGTAKRWRYKTKRGPTGSISKNRPNKGSMFWTKTVFDIGPLMMEIVRNKIINMFRKIGFK